MISALRFLSFSLFSLVFIFGNLYAQDTDGSKRPFYEYKGNYGEEVSSEKAKFKKAFGYNLIDMGRNWSPIEIEVMHAAFKQLPAGFHRIPKLKNLYRLDKICVERRKCFGR